MKDYEYIIRPHHILCFFFYEGKGYDEEFIANTNELTRRLEEENPLIYIIPDTDEVCRKCPNSIEGKCRCEDKVSRYDKAVSELAGVKRGDIARYLDCKKAVYEKIIFPGIRENICSDCVWNEICRRYNKTSSSGRYENDT